MAWVRFYETQHSGVLHAWKTNALTPNSQVEVKGMFSQNPPFPEHSYPFLRHIKFVSQPGGTFRTRTICCKADGAGLRLSHLNVKALAYFGSWNMRIDSIRAPSFLRVSTPAFESQKMRMSHRIITLTCYEITTFRS